MIIIFEQRGENIMDRFYKKTVIVTGSAAGIGKAISCLFAKEKANLVFADINSKNGEKLEGELKNIVETVAFFMAILVWRPI